MKVKTTNPVRMPSLKDLCSRLPEDKVKALKEDIYNEVLTRNRDTLCKKIQPDRHFPLLRERKVFSLSTEQEIEANVTTEKKVQRFLDELQRVGGTTAFPTFIESIDKTQTYLKEQLNKCYESLASDVPMEIAAKYWDAMLPIDQSSKEVHRNIVTVEPATEHPPFDEKLLLQTQESMHERAVEDEEELDYDPAPDDEIQELNQL